MMRRRQRLWIILLAAPLLLLAADWLYWHLAVRNLQDGFAAWVAEQRAAGWRVQFRQPTEGGWPLAATLDVPAMSVEGGATAIPGGLAWQADSVTLRVGLARPTMLRIQATGRQTLRVADTPPIAYGAEHLRLIVPLQADLVPRFADLDIGRLRADQPAGEDLSIGALHLRLDLRPEAPSGEPALQFVLTSAGISPPAGIPRPFGVRIASLTLNGTVSGPVASGDSLANRAVAWRDGGGSVEIQRLALVWGPLDLTATATLALDEQLQPMGAGSTRVIGYAETLDALAAHAAISRSAATAAKAVLSLLAHSPDDGSAPDVEVPLTLQYRTLSMRQVPLVRLPEVDWP